MSPYGSDLAQNSVWHTNSARSVDLDRSRTQIPSFSIVFHGFHHFNDPKTHFLKNKKKYLKFFWGVRGAKPPGWLKRLLKQVNISLLTMSKPFQSCQNPSKHAKNLENQVLKSNFFEKIKN